MASSVRAAKDVSPGLRERKASATRLSIVRALRQRLESTPLAEISVDDLAADANVSRMTFFNYFPTKEHAVDFLMMAWLFELGVGIRSRSLRGVAAIEAMFATMGDEVARSPALWPRIFGHFATRPRERQLPTLAVADAVALGGDAASLTFPPTLGGMLIQHVEDARRDGQLPVDGSSYELAHYLGGLAMGAALVGHSSPDTDWRRLYRRHIQRALGLLGRAEPKRRQARAPASTRKPKGDKPR